MKNIFFQLNNFLQKKIFFSVTPYFIFLIITLLVILNIVVIKTNYLPGGFIKIPNKCVVETGITHYDYPPGVAGVSSDFISTRVCYSIFQIKFWHNLIFSTKEKTNIVAHTNLTPPKFAVIHPSYPANYDDNTILLGASHNIFIGKVIAQVSTKDFVGNPATQFSVEVIKNIKGDLHDTVTVNQEGGVRNGVFYQVEESTLLQLGSTYLLAARYEPDGDMYTLNPHSNASKLLSTDTSLSDAELKKLADQDEKTNTLEAAYPNEQLLEADVYHSNVRNSFQSLPADEKTAAQSRADTARAALGGSGGQ